VLPQACTNYVQSILGSGGSSRKRKNVKVQSNDTERFGAMWSQILGKALLKVCKNYQDVPLMHLLTG
jgi:hypothetical protein